PSTPRRDRRDGPCRARSRCGACVRCAPGRPPRRRCGGGGGGRARASVRSILAPARTALVCARMERSIIHTDDAPEAVGPYSQAVRAGDLLFCSGQIPLDPSTGELVKEDAPGQARRCLENLSAVCRAAGADLGRAVRCTVYLTDMAD